MQGNQEVKELFIQAVALGDAEREDLLSGHPDQDSSLRCRELMKALERPDDYLESEASSMLGAPWAGLGQDAPTSLEPSREPKGAASKGEASGAAPSADAEAPAPRGPEPQVPGYDIIHLIGRGGVGEVWLARNRVSLQFCALKVVGSASSVELEGIRQYKERVQEHPHLYPIEHVGEVDGQLFCVMPLAENAGAANQVLDPSQYEALTLWMHIARKGRLEGAEVIEIGAGLAEALAYLHERGTVHCDLKPANVMRLGGTWRIGDHGLMANLKNKTAKGWTEGFCPPEGPGTPAADQYALGRTLFMMWTGLEPERFADFRDGRVGLPEGGRVASALRDLIVRCCALQPHERFASCGDIRKALKELSPRANAPKAKWPASRLGLFGLAAVVVGAGVVATVMSVRTEEAPVLPPVAAIKSFSVQHLTEGDANQATPTGIIGLNPVTVQMNDNVRIFVELAVPSYCYLIALNPDGTIQHCPPDLASVPPEKTSSIAYPPAPEVWGLTDGAGLQAFALVASSEPLPSFDEWSRSAGDLGWKRLPAEGAGVWEFDGQAVQPLLAHRGEARTRTIAPAPFEQAVAKLDAMPNITVRAVAFPVTPKP